ncbi:hypothetical protein SERLADRAFT_458986 [Serpula lacrymans var. lacrymans S7.9]|uniref:Protein kinase domain-containing protein n=1 Tax=Serpula lacrymans var. lacrymans (strain S7.9) TaxID=578457 RepID=F8NL05_SERL9|nr:uncharacterized protein SERLADRAFT_458986 [Serpula lacrymans var. lacrymans S7.9]EGO28513.1 hypothetical protein SERLADRAFT_458986 [Serpula lacrymans var. lacrymans S7.9]
MAANLHKKFIGAVNDEWQLYSDRSSDYSIGSPIGYGASSIVYSAVYTPPSPGPPIPCALKVLDLDSLPPHSLSLLRRETQLMSLSKHPNVLRVRGTWIDGHKLYIATRLMSKGSAADVMHYGWPGGMEEEVVKSVLKQALEGLNYLHVNGFIHRDVKAANLLIDDDGTVLLGDLGVAASLVEEGDSSHKHANPMSNRFNFDPTSASKTLPLSRPKMGKRKSFVGTPCWMAPELIQGKQYDSSADVWSFAITALELTQGRPPGFRDSPHAVLLHTVQGAPPMLDRDGGFYKYSRAFKDVVDSCLVKDPSKRPTASQLLQSPFFKSAKKKSYLVGAILDGLPPLAQRQERRRCQPSMMTHGTMDSWDFNMTHVGSPAGSVVGLPLSPIKPHFGRSLSSASGNHVSESPIEEIFEFDSINTSADAHREADQQRGPKFGGRRNRNRNDNTLPVIAHPDSPLAVSTHAIQAIEPVAEEKTEEDRPTPPSLPSSLSSSVSSSVGSAGSRSGRSFPPPESTSSGSDSSHSGPTAPNQNVTEASTPHSAPIPIAKRSSTFLLRKKSNSPSTPPSHSRISASPSSPLPSAPSSFWQKLRRPSVTAEEDKKSNGFARMLGRRGSSSASPRPF